MIAGGVSTRCTASRGRQPYADRKAREKWLAEENPVATAMSTIDSDVPWSNCAARARRSAR